MQAKERRRLRTNGKAEKEELRLKASGLSRFGITKLSWDFLECNVNWYLLE